jgi:hypothetical protein
MDTSSSWNNKPFIPGRLPRFIDCLQEMPRSRHYGRRAEQTYFQKVNGPQRWIGQGSENNGKIRGTIKSKKVRKPHIQKVIIYVFRFVQSI